MYPYLLLLFLQAPAQQGVPLLEDCSEPARVIATLSADDQVQVRSSLAGGAKTCYAVTASIDGKSMKGYVLGDALPAVAAFERQRPAIPLPVAEEKPAAPAVPPQVEAPRLPVFADFSAIDVKGRPVSLHGLKGKATLICFWTPNNPSQIELLLVNRLAGLYRREGLNAVTVSMSSQRSKIMDSLEDFQINLPTITDSGIAAAHGVSAIPVTYLLNEKHEIVASGVHGKALESAVQKLMSAK